MKKSRKKKERKRIFDQEGVEKLAALVKKVREDNDVTQEELAHDARLTLSQVARIETSKGNPTVSTIFAIARALQVRPSIFMDFALPPFKD